MSRIHYRGIAAAGVAALIAGSVAAASGAAASPSSTIVSRTTALLNSCALPSAGHASCLSVLRAHRVTLADGTTRPAAAATTPTGFGPSDLHSAYNLPTTGGTGQTVGIVDAFNDPTAAADLAVYRANYGLPACTVASGCLRQVGETGTSTLPTTDTGWAQEESLDLDMVSAICPNCKILLVEATSASDADLAASVNEAATLGATEISNSYGGAEASSETADNADYTHPGIAITASAGDSGYGVEFPAAAPSVTAVGGTSLTKDSSTRGWTETVWGSATGGGLLSALGTSATEGTGSGCSAYEPKPVWQKDTGCAKRTVADVSAVADPNTGVAVYDSTADSTGDVGWEEFGGTSVSSPIIASVYALAGGVSSTVSGAQLAYANPSSLNDVTSGTNGSCTGGVLGFGGTASNAYLCTAQAGYDGPTGLGTPNGTGAF
jgi:subtilase family serine protease